MIKQLPENDPDLQLARQIGRLLDEDESLTSLGDPLVGMLDEYAGSRRRRESGADIRSGELWSHIEKDIRKTSGDNRNQAPVTRLFSPGTLRWSAAAVLLIAALVGFAYFQFMKGPALIAESAMHIETVQLPDGSSVTMRPHSKLYKLSQSGENRVYRIAGEAYFEVTTNPDRNFIVEAGRGRVRVLGTKFTVSSWGNLIQVFLEEGRVRFEGPSRDHPVNMEPGQSSILAADQTQPVLTEPDAKEFTDWLNNELVFQNKPARYVFSEVEQHFNITIDAPESTRDMNLSGALSLENQQAALDDLALVLDGSFRKTGEKNYTFVTK